MTGENHIMCIRCIHVFRRERPVLYICRANDEGDNIAEYMCGQEDHFSVADGKIVGFSHLKDADPSILDPWLVPSGAAFARSADKDSWHAADLD
ncbi:hypothetical protein PE067_08790 [Paracoccus sp. DMF-8]|uniref:hypothetical protein n=1 Tax=Paracoccus sp. DMF-8 TaxID=3019445 RepID=UPI0023E8E1A2|nr:hypothetical protein [Paracoccus sp. DMF-8]MDF3606220.1 hypothetical protein [Paracoccus sp. DMF-8]